MDDIRTRTTVPRDAQSEFAKEAALRLYQKLGTVGDYNGALGALKFWHLVASEDSMPIDI